MRPGDVAGQLQAWTLTPERAMMQHELDGMFDPRDLVPSCSPMCETVIEAPRPCHVVKLDAPELTDVRYAMKQLLEAEKRQYTGQGCVDALNRAYEALERVEESLSGAK